MLLCLPNSTTAELSFVQCTEVCFKNAPVCLERRCPTYRTCSREYDHVTPILKELHWLPVSERIKLKIMLLTFKAFYQQSPVYIQDLLTYYQPSRIIRSSHL